MRRKELCTVFWEERVFENLGFRAGDSLERLVEEHAAKRNCWDHGIE